MVSPKRKTRNYKDVKTLIAKNQIVTIELKRTHDISNEYMYLDHTKVKKYFFGLVKRKQYKSNKSGWIRKTDVDLLELLEFNNAELYYILTEEELRTKRNLIVENIDNKLVIKKKPVVIITVVTKETLHISFDSDNKAIKFIEKLDKKLTTMMINTH